MTVFGQAPADSLKRAVAWFLTGCLVLSGYALAKLEPFAAPVELSMSSLDDAIPLLPWTVWLYGTVTWASLLAWLQVPDRAAAGRLFGSMFVAAAVCWVFFLAWPTTFPRHLFPLPAIDSATVREFADLRAADSPSNCFPSMHVALAWSLGLSWASFLKRRWSKPLPLVWAAVVSVCTLTTKQHYVIDVPAGFVVGAVAWGVVHKLPLASWMARLRGVRGPSLTLVGAREREVAANLRRRVEGHQWSLDEVPWPDGPLPPLDPTLVRLINEVTWIEEIAGLNFRLLADASKDEDLRVLYTLFADEERRHADGLRRLLALHCAPVRPPGLGNALVLDQFDRLDPNKEADAALVSMATPVFETFLDAGTIPFLKSHPALSSPAFDAFVARVDRDESAHMALNWVLTRDRARHGTWLRGLRLLLNPSIPRGVLAIPFMSLDVYSLACRMGYRFETLLPAFRRLWTQHRRYKELSRYPLWMVFRLFVVCGLVATVTTLGLQRLGLLWGRMWTSVTSVTDRASRLLFGDRLLDKRGLRLPVSSNATPLTATPPDFEPR